MSIRKATSREIETERLIMRPHGPRDFADCAAMWADTDVVRFIGGKPSTREESWSRLLRYAGHWATMDFGYWAVREKQSGRFIGDIGLSEFRREIVPSIEGTAESGWAVAAAAHGKGYATEAVRGALAWYEDAFGPQRTVCMISPENTPSLRVAEKVGYREFVQTQYKGAAVILFERLAS
jgi:RimJ/RimL family protein N-acetyltransferase